MERIALDGEWRLRRAGDTRTVPARVPGCVHTDLLAAGEIEDPLFRDNEKRLRWIGETDWEYDRYFELPARFLDHERVLLVCRGLDTLARITINGRPAGGADNMFRTWEFDVGGLLRTGRNHVRIRFDSAMRYVRRRGQERPLPAWGVGDHKLDGGGWIRKQPCNFGWDWGPALVTCGIWRPIELLAFDTARLDDVRIDQSHGRDRVELDLHLRAGRTGRAALAVETAVCLRGRHVAGTRVQVSGSRARTTLTIPRPQPWWPNGMGGRAMYDVRVNLLGAGDERLDSRHLRIGFRTVRLVREPDRWGESFRFSVNGRNFFARGANWIPPAVFVAGADRERYRDLLQSAADANMNMLRVWGGGIYEDDTFYELCDELGLLVWQDFMFACATYPAFDDDFLENVRAEAHDNVRRLRHHACLAVWCGNNELEQGLVGPQWSGTVMGRKDYGRLFDQLLPAVAKADDPQRPYWPASPHSPRGDRSASLDQRWGDVHIWDVWHGRKGFEFFRTTFPRFCSEFGFQSFPEPGTVNSFSLPCDRNLTSPVMEHHQRSGIGNAVIVQYMLDWFRMPRDFETTLWLSQILQATGISCAVEHWRRQAPRCAGALYWQLNDCWPAASWSSIDSLGRWKALHYIARRFYAAVLVSAVADAGKNVIDIHVSNDRDERIDPVLHWTVTDLDGRCLESGNCPASVRAGQSRRVHALRLAGPAEKHGRENLLAWIELREGRRVVSTTVTTLVRPKSLELAPPRITSTVRRTRNRLQVVLQSARPALYVWLALRDRDARFSDNFFHLRPGRQVVVDLREGGTLTPARLRKALVVRSLRDTYNAG